MGASGEVARVGAAAEGARGEAAAGRGRHGHVRRRRRDLRGAADELRGAPGGCGRH